MAQGVIDCITCLIQHANRLPTGGTHIDNAGVTHSVLLWARKAVLVCTLTHDDLNGVRERYVIDQTVYV